MFMLWFSCRALLLNFRPYLERKGLHLKEDTVVVTGQLLRLCVSDRVPRSSSAEVVHLVVPSTLDCQQQPESLNRRTLNVWSLINIFIFIHTHIHLPSESKQKWSHITRFKNSFFPAKPSLFTVSELCTYTLIFTTHTHTYWSQYLLYSSFCQKTPTYRKYWSKTTVFSVVTFTSW